MIDIEFSLALNNRTGKFFAARDMLYVQPQSINSLLFWRLERKTVPDRLTSRALGWLMAREIELRASRSPLVEYVPRLRRPRPVLFMDPLQIIFHNLQPSDAVVVHDLGPVTHPRFYHRNVGPIYRGLFERICSVKPHIIFVSEASQDEYVSAFGPAYRSAQVIYNPVRREARGGETEPAPGVTRPFLLTVGALGWRKNQAGALQAFSASGLVSSGFQFVLSGGPEPGHEDVTRTARHVQGAVVLGYTPEAQLRWLYENAAGFVLLSHLEGFGMPAAEATANGLVCLLSLDPALKEVAGEGALYADAGRPEDVAAMLVRLATMGADERATRLQLASARLDLFSTANIEAGWRKLLRKLEAQ